jgi:hypothetical protein
MGLFKLIKIVYSKENKHGSNRSVGKSNLLCMQKRRSKNSQRLLGSSRYSDLNNLITPLHDNEHYTLIETIFKSQKMPGNTPSDRFINLTNQIQQIYGVNGVANRLKVIGRTMFKLISDDSQTQKFS